MQSDESLAPAATPAVRDESPHPGDLPEGEGAARGLKPGEPVIVEGGYSLPDGTSVTVETLPAGHRGNSGVAAGANRGASVSPGGHAGVSPGGHAGVSPGGHAGSVATGVARPSPTPSPQPSSAGQ